MSLIAGGDILEISIDNPDVGVVYYEPMSGEENEIVFGGIQADDNKAVTSAGTLVVSYKRVVGTTELMVASDESSGGANQYEQTIAIAASQKESVCTIAMVTGVVYKASGVVAGELKLNVYKSGFSLPFVSGLGFIKQ